jgi:2-iminobutanoate/2-iminopropanoate deaminase
LTNLSAVLEAGGSSLKNVVKVNVFITTMKDFDAMNVGYLKFFSKPLPVSFSRP